MSWATIKYKKGQPHRDVIEHWYYNCGNENTGDFAYGSFDLVYCICVPLGAQTFTLPLSEQDPYERTFYIVYQVREGMCEIQILGGLLWKSLMNGPMLISSLIKSRAFLELYEDTMVIGWHKQKEFIFPANFPDENPFITDCFPFNRDALHARIDYYIGWAEELNDEFSPMDEAVAIRLAHHLECMIEMTYSIPNTLLDKSKMRLRFHQLYMNKEYVRFRELLPDIATEDDVIDVLVYNGLFERKGFQVFPPPPQDQRCFAQRHPKKRPPSCYFAVPMVEVPYEMAMKLPIYKGGLVHIAYADVADWVWNLFAIQRQLEAFDGSKLPNEFAQDDWLKEPFTRLCTWLVQHLEGPAPSSNGRRGHISMDNNNNIVIDKENLISLVPPCFKRIMEQKEFMKNNQRLHWVSTMQFVGISRESIASFLDAMNDAYPKGYSSAKARFDYDYVLKKRPGPTYCENIVKNRDPNGITCPFASEIGDVEDLASSCKDKCAPGERAFRGPAALIMRAIYRSGYMKKEEELCSPKEEEPLKEESDEEDEEEEEED